MVKSSNQRGGVHHVWLSELILSTCNTATIINSQGLMWEYSTIYNEMSIVIHGREI